MDQQLEKIRHSLSHLLAMAVLEIRPQAILGIGPTIDNGFYYDFDLDQPLTDADLPHLQKSMKKMAGRGLTFARINATPEEAARRSAGQIYKLELIADLKKSKQPITYYQSGEFSDLCAGPHVSNTKEINTDAFKLTRLAGAYWRGSEKNKMLQRIYGLSFSSREELNAHLALQELAKKNDHRKLGQELDLFTFSDLVGKGLPLLTPKGTIIRHELERYTVDEEKKWGYQHVITPPLAKTELYKISGHYPYYKDTMYPAMNVDDDELILRPMTCPHHFMLYKDKPHSYRELPLRMAEISPQFRYEKSGELTGMMRVRLFCLADAHIFCTPEQAEKEVSQVLKLIDKVNQTLGFKKGKDYFYRLSLGDRGNTEKYYQDAPAWEFAENLLRRVLKKAKAPNYEAPGEAAFYGPKIDVQMKRLNGQEDTAFTVQYDFIMPKRFDMKYTDNKGREQQPVVIHRSSIGAFERTMAFLIEHYAGALPVWLSPVQVKILTVGKAHRIYGKKLLLQLLDAGIRAELDAENETVGFKIRQTEKLKIPYALVIGDKELNGRPLAVRQRGQSAIKKVAVKKFIAQVLKQIVDKKG